jgi:hypothetical protein
VQEILQAAAGVLPLREMLAVVADMTIVVFYATTCWFMRAEAGVLRTVVARGERAEAMADLKCGAGTSADSATTRSAPTILQPRDIDPQDPVAGALSGSGQTVVLLPVRTDGRLLGLLGCTVPAEATHDTPNSMTGNRLAKTPESRVDSAQTWW